MRYSFIIAVLALLGMQACNWCRTPDPCPPVPLPVPEPRCVADPNRPGLTSTVDRHPIMDSIRPNNSDLMIADSTWVDMSIDTLYTLHTSVRVKYPGGNNCADSTLTNALITLPQNTVVKAVEARSLHTGQDLAWEQCKGLITVHLSYLCPEYKSDTISITVRRSRFRHPGCQPSFSVHAYSSMPDRDPSNNYWWWRRECGSGKNAWTPQAPTWGPR